MRELKILVDLIHPANIHYFKNFIFESQKKGYNIIITARDKDVLQSLLNEYQLQFTNMGNGSIGKGAIGKMLYLIKTIFLMLFYIIKYKPNVVLSFSSTPCAVASWLLRVPHISFDDTEHAKLNRKLYVPFTKLIATPFSFKEYIGKKQYKFKAYMELFYLHPNRFKPDESVLGTIGVKKGEPYVLFRFVSWEAFHDIGQHGISFDIKKELIEELQKYAKIFISSETELPDIFKPFQIKISPVKMHDVLSFASLYIGEGATMASECAMMGTPAIYVNSLTAGTLEQQEKDGLISIYKSAEGVLPKAVEILRTPNIKEEFQSRRLKMLNDKIDPTALLVWLIDNYPESKDILLRNPEYQFNLK